MRPSTSDSPQNRPETLEGATLRYAPENELGVVFLFAQFARKHRLRIDKIRAGFPDCIAYQKGDSGEKRIRIEFEFRSRNFRTHVHRASDCDWIVCWEHNWPAVPKHIRVIELRREFGLGFNVWVQPVGVKYKGDIAKARGRVGGWSVPSRASVGDLLLFYHNAPEQCIKDIFIVASPVRYQEAGWKAGMDYMTDIKRVCQLGAPVFWDDLKRDRILQTASFVRSKMRSRPNVTEYWPYLYELITRRNPTITKQLAKYAPDRLT